MFCRSLGNRPGFIRISDAFQQQIAPSAVACIILLLSFQARADYLVEGPIRGRECSTLLLFMQCNDVQVDAIRTGDNSRIDLFILQKSASATTEYDAAAKTCYIKIEAGSASLFGGISVSQFLQKQEDGSLRPIRPSLLIFACRPE